MNLEDFVTYSQADKLKDLGFDWECDYHYSTNSLGFINLINVHEFYHMVGLKLDDGIPAPTLGQAQKWLREVKGVDITIGHVYHRLDTGDKIMYSLHIGNQSTFKTEFYLNYDSYEEALSAGIDSALKFLTQQSSGNKNKI